MPPIVHNPTSIFAACFLNNFIRNLLSQLRRFISAGYLSIMPKNGIPDRWLDYTAIGSVIPGTRLVPMKVPLKKQLLQKIPETNWLSCQDVVQHFQKNNIPLGLVIDLTFTKRYYNPAVFIEQGVEHFKIFIPGHEIPSDDDVKKFKEAINTFLTKNRNNNRVIAVHCTHGVNRTGYLICRYLIEDKSFGPEESIRLFGKSRGHDIERTIYTEHLRSMQNDFKSETVKQSEVLHSFFKPSVIRQETPRKLPHESPANCNGARFRQVAPSHSAARYPRHLPVNTFFEPNRSIPPRQHAQAVYKNERKYIAHQWRPNPRYLFSERGVRQQTMRHHGPYHIVSMPRIRHHTLGPWRNVPRYSNFSYY